MVMFDLTLIHIFRYLFWSIIEKLGTKGLKLLKQRVIALFLLRDIDNFVDNFHDVWRVISTRIILYYYFIVPQKIILFVVSIWYFFYESFEFIAGSFGVSLWIFSDNLWANRLQIFINKSHQLSIDLNPHIFIDGFACFFDINQNIFSSKSFTF